MGKAILFWLNKPDGNLADDLWTEYTDLMGIVCVACVVVFAVMIWAMYRHSTNNLLIRRAPDPFGPYTPLYWLLLAIVPCVIVAGVAWYLYDQRFQGANSFAGGSAVMGVYCLVLTLLLGYAAILAATPLKFKYRARIWV